MDVRDGWVLRLDAPGDGPRVAVKDAIAVAGVARAVGSRAVAADAVPAERDAACVAAVRRSGGRIVGVTALSELCWDEGGINPALGTPVNPLDPTRTPGGSSSGSAVVVARGEADVALGTDTGGSVRIPAACCGIAGLRTTWGRIPLDGVWPLAPSYDTVGPLARDVAGLVLGMRLLEPGFAVRAPGAPVVARIRPAGVVPEVDAAVDAALAVTGWRVVERAVPDWPEHLELTRLIGYEGARANAHLLARRELLSPEVLRSIERGLTVPDERAEAWRARLADVRLRFLRLLDGVDALALPTLDRPAPRLDEDMAMTWLTFAAGAARLPALALPVPMPGPVPASLQLIGRPYAEETLLGLGATVRA